LHIERLNTEKSDIHNESIHIAEQSAQKQLKIQQLEAVSYLKHFSVF